ncbi:enoyl-CoA hydratase/isomerase family protein [Acinetobacter sp. AS23]|uniref:enoyl-CoA hydratase/isomerase family protein n=1 Tax=Acinetobacter sp. AS23 TaxID=2871688 RepID=UPI002026F7C2|nr:enoyl-CoA hydratase/isomerase family protein [Acinetobacter sp. AS23]URM41967.1 enoyl-CoA hydratase/isomerase family protein [Acinetobacter sp. AS23]
MSDELLVEITGTVATLTLNRPKAMNALNLAVLGKLEQILPELATNQDVRVVVLTGTGPAFCAGADLKEVLGGQQLSPGEQDFLGRAAVVFNLLREFPKPVIAALNGVTMAGGLEIAMCADIVLAAESAKIGDAHSNFGVYPGAGGAAILPRLVPLNVAMYLLYTGKTLSAAQMYQYGFVNEVHPDDQLTDAVNKLAQQLSTKSPIVLQRMKQVARHTADKTREDALLHEQVMLREHLRSYDIQEGLRAFSEKRAPVFKGY